MYHTRVWNTQGLAAIATAVAGACCLMLGGCGTTQERAYTLELAPTTGPLAIDIENFRGSIELRTNPALETVQVVGEVHVDESFKKPVLDEIFASVNITAELKEDGPRGTVQIRSTSTRAEDDHEVTLTIMAPRCDGLRVVNSGGLVLAVNTGGATEIRNHLGAVEVRTSRPMVDDVTITTTDGSIYYQVPPGSTGTFDLQSLDGIAQYIDRVGQSAAGQSGSREVYSGTLNEGMNKIVARTNKGDVRVWVIEDPVALVRIHREPIADIRDSMYLHGSQRYLRNLPVNDPEVTGEPSRQGKAWEY